MNRHSCCYGTVLQVNERTYSSSGCAGLLGSYEKHGTHKETIIFLVTCPNASRANLKKVITYSFSFHSII